MRNQFAHEIKKEYRVREANLVNQYCQVRHPTIEYATYVQYTIDRYTWLQDIWKQLEGCLSYGSHQKDNFE